MENCPRVWLYGGAGVGKTTRLRQTTGLYVNLQVRHPHPQARNWYPLVHSIMSTADYSEVPKVLLLDDVTERNSEILEELVHFAEGGEFVAEFNRVHVRSSSVTIKFDGIQVASSVPPEEVFPNSDTTRLHELFQVEHLHNDWDLEV